MIFLKLLWSFIKVGLFSVGGGYAAIPLIEAEVVGTNAWISPSEFSDLVTIAEMTPGPIAVNAATFVGIRICGFVGALVATFGCILPSCIIVSALAKVYITNKNNPIMKEVLAYMRACVVALIASAGLKMFLNACFHGEIFSFSLIDVSQTVIFIVALVILRVFKKNPMMVLGISGLAGLLIGVFKNLEK